MDFQLFWDNYGIGTIIGIALVIIFFVIMVRRGRISKIKVLPKKICRHDWRCEGGFVARELPRVLFVCKKCGVAVHRPALTLNQLKAEETNER